MKLGFTGTQVGMTDAQKSSVMKAVTLTPTLTEIHSGDCIGADKDFLDIVDFIGGQSVRKVGHIPIYNNKRAFCKYTIEREPKPYLERNHDIVDESDVLLATPKEKEEQLRSGTWATIRYAKKKGKRVVIIYPDGTLDVTKEK